MKHTKSIYSAIASAALVTATAQAANTAVDGDIAATGPGLVSQQTQSNVGEITTDELPILQKGVTEFGLSGYLDWTNDVTYSTNASYGVFVTDCWLIGAKLGLVGENSEVDFSGGLFTEYNFQTGTKWVPFIGIGANWARIDSDTFSTDAVELAGEFGVKYFLRSNVAVSASMSGTWASDTLPEGDDFGSRVNFGLRYFF